MMIVQGIVKEIYSKSIEKYLPFLC